jgi:hypothetical protein
VIGPSISMEGMIVSEVLMSSSHMVQEGMFVQETLALQAGTICRETVAKHDTPVLDLCNSMY